MMQRPTLLGCLSWWLSIVSFYSTHARKQSTIQEARSTFEETPLPRPTPAISLSQPFTDNRGPELFASTFSDPVRITMTSFGPFFAAFSCSSSDTFSSTLLLHEF